MGKNKDIVHSIKCLDPKTPVRERCHKCYRKYRNENAALNRQKNNDLIKKTRSVIDKKRSIYSNLLCDLCKDKTQTILHWLQTEI